MMKFTTLILVVCVLGVARLALPLSYTSDIVRFTGYWFCALSVALAAAVSSRLFQRLELERSQWRKLVPAIVLVTAISIYWQIHERDLLRTLMDEHGYESIAQNMHVNREAVFSAKAHLIDGQQYVLNHFVDKRAVLFPFILSVVHDLIGFSIDNVFWLNAFLAWVALWVLFCIGSRLGGVHAGYVSVALLAGFPVLPNIANGGGYDLLNAVLLLVWFYSALRFFEDKNVADWLNLAVVVSVLLAQIRNESVIYCIITFILVAVDVCHRRELRISGPAIVSYASLLPAICANRLFDNLPVLREAPSGVDFFSISYFSENFGNALVFLFRLDMWSLNSKLLSSIGTIAVLIFYVNYLKRGFNGDISSHMRALFVFGGGVLACCVIYMCVFWGDWNDGIVSRFSVSLHLFFTVVVSYIYGQFNNRLSLPYRRILVVAALAYAVMFSTPASSQMWITKNLQPAQGAKALHQLLEKQSGKRVLVFTDFFISVITRGGASMSPLFINNEPWKVQYAIETTYDEVWYFQRFAYTANDEWVDLGKYDPSGVLDMKLVERYPVGPNVEFRLFRVVGVKAGKFDVDKLALATATKLRDPVERFKHTVNSLP